MTQALETIKHDESGLRAEIFYDHDAFSPLEDDNLGTIIYWHPRLLLGDENALRLGITPEEFQLRAKTERLLVLPLYVYEHGGVTIRTSAFGDPWDSGQVGYIYVSREQVLKEYGGTRLTKKIREQAIGCLEGEVASYRAFLEGQVYGYTVSTPDDDELDSCWGFIGDMDYVVAEATAAMEAQVPAYQEALTLRARQELGA